MYRPSQTPRLTLSSERIAPARGLESSSTRPATHASVRGVRLIAVNTHEPDKLGRFPFTSIAPWRIVRQRLTTYDIAVGTDTVRQQWCLPGWGSPADTHTCVWAIGRHFVHVLLSTHLAILLLSKVVLNTHRSIQATSQGSWHLTENPNWYLWILSER